MRASVLWCAGAKTPSVTEAPFPYSVSSYGQFWFHRNDGVAWHAATALLLHVPLVTHNAADFEGIEGLEILTEQER